MVVLRVDVFFVCKYEIRRKNCKCTANEGVSDQYIGQPMKLDGLEFCCVCNLMREFEHCDDV